MISDAMVEKALAFLDDTTTLEELAREAHLAAHLVKHVEAREIKAADCAVTLRQAYARASKEYHDVIMRDSHAWAAYEAYKGRRQAAQAVIDTWRTQNANARIGARVG